jgi:hypothetical protein
MADPPPHPDTDTDTEIDAGQAPGAPRWVKVFGTIALVLVLLFVVLKLTGHHGPSRHLPSRDGGVRPAPVSGD